MFAGPLKTVGSLLTPKMAKYTVFGSSIMAKFFQLTDDSHVSMVTFGNQVNWIMKKGEKMIYNFVKEVNNSFIVLQSGLNLYVFETKSCPPIEEHKDYD